MNWPSPTATGSVPLPPDSLMIREQAAIAFSGLLLMSWHSFKSCLLAVKAGVPGIMDAMKITPKNDRRTRPPRVVQSRITLKPLTRLALSISHSWPNFGLIREVRFVSDSYPNNGSQSGLVEPTLSSRSDRSARKRGKRRSERMARTLNFDNLLRGKARVL